MRRHTVATWSICAGLLVCLAGTFTGRTAADEPLDGPLPEITGLQLVARIREAWRAYDRGLLELAYEIDDNGHSPVGIRQNLMDPNPKTVMIKYASRSRFLCDGQRWRIDFDGQQVGAYLKLFPDRWSTGFDGARHCAVDITRDRVIIGESRKDVDSFTPRRLFWPKERWMLRWLIIPATAIVQRDVDGVRCYVASSQSYLGERNEVVISPRQSFLVIRRTVIKEGKVVESYRLEGVRRGDGGLWVPERVVIEHRRFPIRPVAPPPFLRGPGDQARVPEPPPLPEGPLPLLKRQTIKIVKFDPGMASQPDDFVIEIPYGTFVEDRTTGFAQVNDPWWPEIRGLLTERFGHRFEWPIVDMSPLRTLTPPPSVPQVLPVNGPPEGAALKSPDLRVERWINSGPLDWIKLKGKVTLVKFWSLHRDTWSLESNAKQHAALRRLYETFHSAGLEILAIHENTDDPEAVRQFASELRLPYPIAIDAMAGGKDRTTAEAFGEPNWYVRAFLVDAEGKVHTWPEGQLVPTLVDLLTKAGAMGLSTDQVKEYRLPQEALVAIHNALPALITASRKDGRIAGLVRDGRGRPLAAVPVRATLRFEALATPSPGFLFHDDMPPITTRTGPDGAFAFQALSKGRYRVEASAPGRAAVHRWVTIAPGHGEGPVNLVVEKPDGLAGTVRFGQRGWPMPFALVFLAGHVEPNGVETRTAPFIRMTVANRWGEFGFSGLSAGRYGVSVIGAGGWAEEYVAVGEFDATIRLVPWWSDEP